MCLIGHISNRKNLSMDNSFIERVAIYGMLFTYGVLIAGGFVTALALL